MCFKKLPTVQIDADIIFHSSMSDVWLSIITRCPIEALRKRYVIEVCHNFFDIENEGSFIISL